MTPDLYLAFIAATALLVMTPGPMVTYLVATTLAHGLRHGLMALIGSALASAIQLTIVVIGLSAILTLSGEAFFWIRWIGVAYLVYLALRALTAKEDDLDTENLAKPVRSGGRTIAEAFFVNLTNPKALLFHGAFLPLFISPAAPATPQLILLAVTFVVVAGALDGCWAVFAARLAPLMRRIGRWRHRVRGGVLLAAAAGLALMRKA